MKRTPLALILLVLIPVMPPCMVGIPALMILAFLNTTFFHLILVELLLTVSNLSILAPGLLLDSLLSLLLLLLILLLLLLLKLFALLLVHFLLHLPV